MSAIPTNFIHVPVTTEKAFSTSQITALLIIAGVLVAVVLWLYYKNHHNTETITNDEIEVLVHNLSSTTQTLALPQNKKLNVLAGNTATIKLPENSIVGTSTFLGTGENLKDKFRIDTGFRDYYITDTGISANINNKGVTFRNLAKFPVMFIQRGDGIRRWATGIIPPNSEYTDDNIFSGSRWDVVHPTNESKILASVSGLNSKMIAFDGMKLSSE